MTSPGPGEPPSRAQVSVGRLLAFIGLYLIPALVGLGLLLLIAGRQAGANAFRYVGF